MFLPDFAASGFLLVCILMV